MGVQQCGLGLILTVLIVTAPPMAAAFFQGMLGAFTPYTAFSSDGGARASRDGRWSGGNSYPPGHGGNPGGVQPVSQARADNSGGSLGANAHSFGSNYQAAGVAGSGSEEHTSALPSLMRNSYPVFCLQQKTHET